MATTRLASKFKVGTVTRIVDSDVYWNIKKWREDILYRSASIVDNVNLAYVISTPVTPNNNLHISDHSDFFTANQPIEISDTTFNGISFQAGTDRVLITDIYTPATTTKPATPLFFKHDISDVVASGANTTLLDIGLVDQDQNVVNDVDVVFALNSGLVYSNHLNTFDSTTNDIDLLFLKFTTHNKNDNSIVTRLELLDQEPVFKLASFSDIDESAQLISTRKVYLLDELFGSTFEFTLPRYSTFSYRIDDSSKITIHPPSAVNITNPWFISVTNGSFFTSVRRGLSTFTTYKYNIPEFDTQSFQPFAPFKLQQNEVSTRVNHHVVQTLRQNITIDATESMHAQVVVRNKDGIPKRAYSTDTSKLGQKFEANVKFTAGLRSIDRRNGFIDVTDPIAFDDIIYTTYYFEEDRYELTSLDLNPITNQDVIKYRWVLYLAPNTTSGRSTALYYLKVDSLGNTIDTSQEDDTSLLSAITAGLNYDLSTVNLGGSLSGTDGLSFVDRFSVQHHLDPALSGHQAIITSNPAYFILGEVFVREAAVGRQSTVLDARIEGGGIKPSRFTEALQKQPEARWYWDVAGFGGLPYPGQGCYYVQVPCSILRDFNGRFRPNEIREVVTKHAALGTYAIIKAYGKDPVPTITNISTSQLTFTWPSGGSGVTWNIRLSTQNDGIFSKQNNTPVSDVSPTNTYTISNLAEGAEYWFYVAQVLDDGSECVGGPIGVEPTFEPAPHKIGFKTLTARTG